jgi:hypothetical protein
MKFRFLVTAAVDTLAAAGVRSHQMAPDMKNTVRTKPDPVLIRCRARRRQGQIETLPRARSAPAPSWLMRGRHVE